MRAHSMRHNRLILHGYQTSSEEIFIGSTTNANAQSAVANVSYRKQNARQHSWQVLVNNKPYCFSFTGTDTGILSNSDPRV